MNRSHLTAWVLTISSLSALCAQPIAAQVVPDATLSVGERSQVSGNPNVQIDGGARRGGNLFHSFSQFSIPTGGSAFFNNAADVQNIFSRVTGGSISNIDGLIRANGTANLFLLNPNGILFGSNASLNIGGSFVATTANSINFADNFQYSATNPQPTPLLTISVPVGLQMGANPGHIGLQGNGYALSVAVPIFSPLSRGSNAAGLRVPVGQTLALIGGDLDIDGATLKAEQGRIDLGSVRDGQVSLSATNPGLAFAYQGSQRFGAIRLSQQALADASGGGLIQVRGNNVSLTDGSLLLIQNRGTQAGGSISVNAAQSLEVSGTNSNGRIYGGLKSENVGSRTGADIAVSTKQLAVERAATITTTSFGPGKAGNVAVNASGSVRVAGFSPINPSLSSAISSGALGSGSGGFVSVSAAQISVLSGGNIASVTFGTGQGGDVTVNATESVDVIGIVPGLLAPSSVASATYKTGSAGKVNVTTPRLVIRGGGAVTTATNGPANAGSIIINAAESVDISGRVPGSSNPSGVRSSAPIAPESIRRAFGLDPVPSGASGDVTINTERLSVTDGAKVDVRNDGSGNGGTSRVNANSIVLDSQGSITAATNSGNGGNIDLNVRDFLLLQNDSQITASAGGTGNGGNIRIDGGSIVAVPTENSDIRANSVNARGGNVTVNASGIFGIQFRPQDTPLSDITATGANSALNGTVQLNIERLDPTSGLVALPTTVVDSSRLIAQGCPANQGSSFVITGRGGLPPTPEQQLDDDAEWGDRRRLVVAQQTGEGRGIRSQESGVRSKRAGEAGEAEAVRGDVEIRGHGDTETKTTQNSKLKTFPSTPIVEATGWQITPAGAIVLVATTPDPTMQNPLNRPIACPGR